MQHGPHHHGDDGEEIPVALHSSEAKRKHVGEENHGRAEADGAQDLWGGESGGHESGSRGGFCSSAGIHTTDHRGEVAGGEQASGVEGEEDDGHAGQDEVVEGDVHRRLAAPVGRRKQTRDTKGGATLDLKRGNK